MKRRFSSSLLAIAITVSFLLTGCGGVPDKPSLISSPSGPTPEPTVTYDPNTGSVKGTILVEQNGKFVPFKNDDLILGNILISSSGRTGVVGMDPGTAPRTSTDDQGSFIFNNIPSGKYGLILYLVTHAYLLNETDKDSSMIITVTAGKVTDLGQLKYTTFPITPQP